MEGFNSQSSKRPGDEKDFQENQKGRMPDFIYIDKDHGNESRESFGGFRAGFDPSFQHMAKREYSAFLRVLCGVLSLFCYFICIIFLPFVLLFVLANLLTLFKAKDFWRQTLNVWEQFKKIFVIGFGLTVAVFSPPFGLSMIMVYFLLKGGNLDENWVGKMMKRNFYTQSGQGKRY